MNDALNNPRDEKVSLSLNGQTHEIDAMAVASALENLVKLVAGFDSETGSIKLAELREGSAVAGVAVSPETKQHLRRGIHEIRSTHRIPAAWSFSQMKRLRSITSLAEGRGADSVTMTVDSVPEPMDLELRRAIDSALTSVIKSIGSVTGELYRYTEKKNGFEAGLRNELTGTPTTIKFSEEFDSEVRRLLRQRVEVRGILYRHPETNAVGIVELRGIEEKKHPVEKVSGFGIWEHLAQPGITGEEIIRELRDSE